MQAHQLKPNRKRYTKKRVGRGGKRGTTAGRGTKGQKARTGNSIRPAIRDLLRRLPKLRGHRNNPKSESPHVLNIADLAKVSESVINHNNLVKAGLIRKRQRKIKILGSGELNRSITIEKLSVSETAKKKIEAAGGSIK